MACLFRVPRGVRLDARETGLTLFEYLRDLDLNALL